jgi:hypothetical protein
MFDYKKFAVLLSNIEGFYFPTLVLLDVKDLAIVFRDIS